MEQPNISKSEGTNPSASPELVQLLLGYGNIPEEKRPAFIPLGEDCFFIEKSNLKKLIRTFGKNPRSINKDPSQVQSIPDLEFNLGEFQEDFPEIIQHKKEIIEIIPELIQHKNKFKEIGRMLCITIKEDQEEEKYFILTPAELKDIYLVTVFRMETIKNKASPAIRETRSLHKDLFPEFSEGAKKRKSPQQEEQETPLRSPSSSKTDDSKSKRSKIEEQTPPSPEGAPEAEEKSSRGP